MIRFGRVGPVTGDVIASRVDFIRIWIAGRDRSSGSAGKESMGLRRELVLVGQPAEQVTAA
jgi:hypothetical protein